MLVTWIRSSWLKVVFALPLRKLSIPPLIKVLIRGVWTLELILSFWSTWLLRFSSYLLVLVEMPALKIEFFIISSVLSGVWRHRF